MLLPFPAANRDPHMFEDPDTFIVDREQNRHAAFGLGIHRCLGSNLARLELKVAIEEFIARFPRFELAGDVRWSIGQIRGPRELPIRILETAVTDRSDERHPEGRGGTRRGGHQRRVGDRRVAASGAGVRGRTPENVVSDPQKADAEHRGGRGATRRRRPPCRARSCRRC